VRVPVLISTALASSLFGAVACELPGTGGEFVETGWRVEGLDASRPIVVAGVDGWQVELLEARLLIGPIYLFAPPVTERGALAELFAPGRALAHAGDDNTVGGRVVTELLDQYAYDLLDPEPQLLPPTVAEAGPVDIANVVLDEARFGLAVADGPTRGGHAFLRGVARREVDGVSQVVRFSAVLGPETVRDDRIARRVEALPVVGELETGATVVVQADPRLWVRQMRFDDWAGGATRETDEEIVIDAPSRLHNAWYLGLRDPAGWSLRVEAAESP